MSMPINKEKPNNNIYHVIYNSKDKVRNLLDVKNNLLLGVYKTQLEAELQGKKLEQLAGGGEILIHTKPTKKNPKQVIRKKDTVPKGNDSRKVKG